MKTKVPEEKIMQKRRLERLRHVTFFLSDERVPESGRRVMALMACHNLMTGFFQNSHWQVAWYCVKKATSNSWLNATLFCQFFYWRKILRLTSEQIDERIEASVDFNE